MNGMRRGRILYGVLGQPVPGVPGLYDFISTNGVIKTQVICLTPDADRDGFGDFRQPDPGTPCVVVESDDGGQGFVAGFHTPPRFDEEEQETPTAQTPDENFTPGDKVIRTKGGARLVQKRGGLSSLEGGPGAKVELNPTNNLVSIRGSNQICSADGFSSTRGRKNIGTAEAATFHVDKFGSGVGPSYDRVVECRGAVQGDVRREVIVEAVTVAGGRETTTPSFRQQTDADGSWRSVGPRYEWGSADQNMVLGNVLVDVLGQLIDIIKSLQHTTAVGPTSPPLPIYLTQLDQLKAQLSDILSQFMFLSREPESP